LPKKKKNSHSFKPPSKIQRDFSISELAKNKQEKDKKESQGKLKLNAYLNHVNLDENYKRSTISSSNYASTKNFKKLTFSSGLTTPNRMSLNVASKGTPKY
jgi:hypothetical protein